MCADEKYHIHFGDSVKYMIAENIASVNKCNLCTRERKRLRMKLFKICSKSPACRLISLENCTIRLLLRVQLDQVGIWGSAEATAVGR